MQAAVDIAKPIIVWGGKKLLQKDVNQLLEIQLLRWDDICHGLVVVRGIRWLIVQREDVLVKHNMANVAIILDFRMDNSIFEATYNRTKDRHRAHYNMLVKFKDEAKQRFL